MGGKSKAPAPDPRMAEAANRQIDLAEKQWEDYQANERPWMRGIADRAVGVSERNASKAAELTDYQLGVMRKNDDRYWNTAIPYEDELLGDVRRFDSDSYKQAQVNTATADVESAFGNVEGQNRRALARSRGGPSQASMEAGAPMSIAKASALASAATKTRMAADQIGLSTKMQMYGGMRGLAGLGANNAGLAMGAMGAGQGAAAGMSGAAGSYAGANNAAFSANIGGRSAGISGMGQYTQLGQNAAKINNDADPTAAIIGAAVKVGTTYMAMGSDRRLKEDIVQVGRDIGTGLNLYEFAYIGGDGTRYRGVMADEVLSRYPQAVVTGDDGYMAVHYELLGIDMITVKRGTQ